MTTEMPKYLQAKFKKATNLIKPEHKKFVDFEVMRDICKLADLNIKELK
jgi:hypothetical protein